MQGIKMEVIVLILKAFIWSVKEGGNKWYDKIVDMRNGKGVQRDPEEAQWKRVHSH